MFMFHSFRSFDACISFSLSLSLDQLDVDYREDESTKAITLTHTDGSLSILHVFNDNLLVSSAYISCTFLQFAFDNRKFRIFCFTRMIYLKSFIQKLLTSNCASNLVHLLTVRDGSKWHMLQQNTLSTQQRPHILLQTNADSNLQLVAVINSVRFFLYTQPTQSWARTRHRCTSVFPFIFYIIDIGYLKLPRIVFVVQRIHNLIIDLVCGAILLFITDDQT